MKQCISATSTLQKEQKSLTGSIEECYSQIENLTLRLIDQEDRARQKNIRISGLKEGAEGSNVLQFLSTHLPLWIPALKDTPLDLEYGHRVYSRNQADHPRIVIVKCLRHSTKLEILREARRGKPIMHAGKELRFFVDYSKQTAQKRKAFSEIRSKLTKKGIANFLLHPATLKVTIGKEVMLFKTPEEAGKFVSSPNLDLLLGSDEGAVGFKTISPLPQDSNEFPK